MTKKELKKLEEELQRHGYRKTQPYVSEVVFVWYKTIIKEKDVSVRARYWVWEHFNMEDNPHCEVKASVELSLYKNGFNIETCISSRENMDILQLEGTAYSVLNLLKP